MPEAGEAISADSPERGVRPMTTDTGPDLSVGGLAERDLDLLLLEEFASSPGFLRWFLGRVNLAAKKPRLLRAARSVAHSIGESDLEIFVEQSGYITAILIENKITAAFQNRQAERYRRRGAAYVRNDRCHAFVTVLVAPEAYFGADPDDRKGFDAVVTYESIRQQFLDVGLGARLAYKLNLLDGAIVKARVGYRLEEDPPVTDFWRAYWRLATEVAPELEMPEPGPRPAKSGFIYFTPSDLPRGVHIVHKTRHGNVDLQFYRMGKRLPEMRERFCAHLEHNMVLERAGGSAVIRLRVPQLSISTDLREQVHDATAGLKAASDLLAWYRRLAPAAGPGRSEPALLRRST